MTFRSQEVQTSADSLTDATQVVVDSVTPEAQPDTSGLDVVSVVSDAADALGLEPSALVQKAGQVAVVLVLAWLASRLLKSVTNRWSAKFDAPLGSDEGDVHQRGRTLIQLLNSIGMIVIAVGTGLSVLNLFINIGPLLAGVGVLGLAVSFGAQSLVKDVITGFFILFENQYDVGDVVEINGVAGAVEKMTLRAVTLRDLMGVMHVIPNGSITLVSNRTAGWSRTVLDIGVAYKENVDHVMEVVRQLAADFATDGDWAVRLVQPPEVLGVDSLGDSAVVIRLIAQTKAGKQWEVKRELLRRIKNKFDEAGIEIPFPQRTLHIRSAPPSS